MLITSGRGMYVLSYIETFVGEITEDNAASTKSSVFAGAEVNPVEELDVSGIDRDNSDVEVTLLTVKERILPNAVNILVRTFRKAFRIYCDTMPWSMHDSNLACQQKFVEWDVSINSAFMDLYGDQFIEFATKIEDGILELHECGGLTMIIQRNNEEARVQMKAATMDNVS